MGQVKVQSATNAERRVVATIRGRPASDGAGVKLTRVIGQPALPDLDPFLMLDEFGSDKGADYIGGFPDHPHRGFETVTYMLAGRMRHGDNQGNVGLLRPGSVQWMTAGRGIIHSEMPEQEEGLMQGFQLWVNLPAKDKMVKPRYQDIDPESPRARYVDRLCASGDLLIQLGDTTVVPEPDPLIVPSQHRPPGRRRPERRDRLRVQAVEHDRGHRPDPGERRCGVLANRPEMADHAELVALGVGHHHPRHVVGLADVDLAGAQPLQPGNQRRPVVLRGRGHIEMHPVLGRLGVGNRHEHER